MTRVVVVGAGITGAAAAYELTRHHGVDVEIREASARVGGVITTSPFAGLDAVDEGADAFLLRSPAAAELAAAVGLGTAGEGLVSPTGASAAIWVNGLHPLPAGLMLGVPTAPVALARTGLFGPRGIVRAAGDLVRRHEPRDHDSIGRWARHRFGNQVHDRLVDALVGSIYAADCDRFSLAAVPQLADLAGAGRSATLTARRRRRGAAPAEGPIFAAPRTGMRSLVDATIAAATAQGAQLTTSAPVSSLERSARGGYLIDGEPVDAVVLATPARVAAGIVAGVAAEPAQLLSSVATADVIMVTLALPAGSLPAACHGRSGYLVPKSVQRRVTAVSFASHKWAHWQPCDGSEILRVSIGRDGAPVDDLDDATATDVVLAEVGAHLGFNPAPTEVRVTRWMGAFPQYRPHHHQLVDAVQRGCPTGIAMAGSSYNGIGIPACVADGRRAAREVLSACGVVPVP